MLINMEIEQIAAEARRPRFARAKVGASTGELVSLLRLNRDSVREYYSGVVVGGRVQGQRTLFSRAGVAERISEFSGRPVGFPTKPLLTLRDLKALADSRGAYPTMYGLRWAAWRFLNPDSPKSAGPAPILPVVRVTPTQLRVEYGAAFDYIIDYRQHVPYSRAPAEPNSA